MGLLACASTYPECIDPAIQRSRSTSEKFGASISAPVATGTVTQEATAHVDYYELPDDLKREVVEHCNKEKPVSPTPVIGWILLGAGLASAGVGGLLQIPATNSRQQAFDAGCTKTGACPSEAALATYNSSVDFTNASYASLIAGGATSFVGLIILLATRDGRIR